MQIIVKGNKFDKDACIIKNMSIDGHSVKPVFCPGCGQLVKIADARYCPHCGTKLNA